MQIWCRMCKSMKEEDAFSKDPSRPTGRSTTCKECRSSYHKQWYRTHNVQVRKQVKDWKSRHKEKVYMSSKRSHMRYRYGLSWDDFHRMVEQQGNCCAICRHPFGSLRDQYVDHDHSTQKVRGILCRNCNVLLGHAYEDSAVLRAAADYLDEHL